LLHPLISHDVFFISASADPRDLHSFPTRRSSDLLIVSAPSRPSKFSTPDALLLPLIVSAKFEPRTETTPLNVSVPVDVPVAVPEDRKSTRLNSSHSQISYAVFCLKKKKSNNFNKH